ncbi:hypothetical protein Sros01_81980 [Streptomyces roseochromogenus]|nr:hypothetical protein Sros01_81980 [Streptomyces roseochromogenus]
MPTPAYGPSSRCLSPRTTSAAETSTIRCSWPSRPSPAPTLFWAFIGLGIGLSKTGWAAGLASTGILATLTFGYLLSSSDGHGFDYWLLLAVIVAATLGAFRATPYALVRGAVGRR